MTVRSVSNQFIPESTTTTLQTNGQLYIGRTQREKSMNWKIPQMINIKEDPHDNDKEKSFIYICKYMTGKKKKP